MKRRILICLFICLLISSSVSASRFKFIFTPNAKNVFSETNSQSTKTGIYCDTVGHWCNYSAQRLYEEDIFKGIKIGQNYYFYPDEQINRGEFLLYISVVLDAECKSTGYLPFEDYSSIPQWIKPTVFTMYNAGIIHGNTEKGKLYFNHDEGITRIEAALILNNVLGLNGEFAQTSYSDSYLIPEYASGAIKNVTDYRLMQGYSDKSFRPYIKISRAMLSDILCNLKDYREKEPQVFERLKSIDK